MSLSNSKLPLIKDYVGTILDKYSCYHLFQMKEKQYEIEFRDFLDMRPYIIFHPGIAFIDAVPNKTLVRKVGKPIGSFKTALVAWDYVDHGLGLGFNLSKIWKFL